MLHSLCYKNEIGKINIVYEGFVFLETHDAYTFVLDSLFKMCPLRERNQGYAIFSDEFMTKSILDSIVMNDTFIFYYQFHQKMNLEKGIIIKIDCFKTLHPFNSYFK